ncbi:MAG TPA: DnaJ domain-containing protein [Rhodocyclaceae bacterium]|nr:DnaJ domain-containing protein [Rhodocyclaceae bacterium]
MSTTLYDILEIDQCADQEEIVETYKRLHAELSAKINGIAGADQETLNRMTALREAFNTLSDPERRRNYDARLAARQNQVLTIIEEAPGSLFKTLLLVALIGILAVVYAKFQTEQERTRLERERIAAEARMADLQLQRAREEQRHAINIDFERRRDEAMERAHRGGPVTE